MLWSEKTNKFLGFLSYGETWWESNNENVTVRVMYEPRYKDDCPWVWEYDCYDYFIRHRAATKDLARVTAEKFFTHMRERRIKMETGGPTKINFPVYKCMWSGTPVDEIEI